MDEYHNVLRGKLTAGHIVVVLLTGLFFSLFDYELGLGQGQQPFLPYRNPNLDVSIQYPSDWELQEESDDKLRFIKQEGFVTADLNVEDIDQSDTTLSEYAITRINELRTQRPEFQLVSNEPTTISKNIPAQKVVYTFEREEDGKANKVMRIWSANEGKLYTLAYIAESSQYDQYLPKFQRMVDSFSIDASSIGSSTTQVQSSSSDGEDNNGASSSPPPDGNCDRISYPDPDVCIPPYPPDLDCPEIPYKNFHVSGTDPHGFDGDNDGIGCQDVSSATSSLTPTPQLIPSLTLTPTPPTDKKCPEDTHGTPPDCIPITDYCYLPGIGDWWDNPDCKDYLEKKYKTIVPSPPSLSPPCRPDSEGNEVCPPTDEPTPVPERSPECPDAGPEVCGEDTPPADEEPPDSDTGTDNENGNDGASGDGNGEDGPNGNGNGGDDGDSNNNGELFGN